MNEYRINKFHKEIRVSSKFNKDNEDNKPTIVRQIINWHETIISQYRISKEESINVDNWYVETVPGPTDIQESRYSKTATIGRVC